MIMQTRQQHERVMSRLRAQLRGEEGWAGAVLGAIGIGFVLLVGLQALLWWNGNTIAQLATDTGYSTARSYESTAESGQAAAMQLIQGIPGALRDPQVTINRTGDTVTVTVTGRSTMILPGLELPPITKTQSGPVERWVPAP